MCRLRCCFNTLQCLTLQLSAVVAFHLRVREGETPLAAKFYAANVVQLMGPEHGLASVAAVLNGEWFDESSITVYRLATSIVPYQTRAHSNSGNTLCHIMFESFPSH